MYLFNRIMKNYFIIFFTIIITSCGSSTPNLKLLCEKGESKILFETDKNTNSLLGDDGTSTKFYENNFVEIVFVNFDGSGNPKRVVNYYPTDPGIEIIEEGKYTSWMCEHVN